MNQSRVLPVVILIILMWSPKVFSDVSVEELIFAFEQVLLMKDPAKIQMVQTALKANLSALSYMMANRPELYAQYSELDGFQSGSVLVSKAPEEYSSSPLESLPKKEPRLQLMGDYSRGSDLLKVEDNVIEPPEGESSIQPLAQHLRNINKKLLDQLPEGTVMMSVSGVGPEEERLLTRVLENELGTVLSARKTYAKNGNVVYKVELREVDVERFAYSLDNRRVGVYELDLIKFDDQKVSYILKR